MTTLVAGPVQRRTLPLRIHVATLLVAALLLIGGVLAWQGYRGSKAVLISASDQMLGQVAGGLETAIRAVYGPATTTVDLLSRSPITKARDFDERWAVLPLLVQGLAASPQLEALYTSYLNGDFFIVRPLRTPAARQRFEAPDDAVYMVTSTDVDEQGRRPRVRVFFDADLIEVARKRLSDSSFDATTRPWYQQAIVKGERVLTEPYLFFTTREPGITISRRFELGGGVVAADVTLDQLSRTLAGFNITESTELVLLDHRQRVVAHSDLDRPMAIGEGSDAVLPQLDGLGNTVLGAMGRHFVPGAEALDFDVSSRRWTARFRELTTRADQPWLLALLVPEDELLREANELLRRSAVIAGILVLALVPLAWLLANLIARPLQQLVAETGRIRRLDFSDEVATESRVKEIHDLAASMNTMQSTIEQFLALIGSLSREQAYDDLLDRVLTETMQVCRVGGGVIYLVNDEDSALEPSSVRLGDGEPGALQPLPVALSPGKADDELAAALASHEVRMFRVERDAQAHSDSLAIYFAAFDAAQLSFVVLPLHDRKSRFMGSLCLVNPVTAGEAGAPIEQERLGFVVALSGFAAVSIESQRLLKMEKDLLDAFIRLIAGAIDAKSPYTGGHCQRVPALTMMLAQAASESDAAEFADFHPDDEEWQALHIASWLHDCGKVTTPEYVVDKATKLETIYDRIHEVRMRFEVLKRDAEIRCWRAIADGAERDAAMQALAPELQTLDDEFAFVAECNEGGEFMAPERIERLQAIGVRTWQRTLDDRVGISWAERTRKARSPAPTLPVDETLLADKPEHLIERDDTDDGADLAERGFRMEVPEYAYNRGELYNLCIARGTLSAEERFKINDHIVQTILMLEELPFPRHLRAVPQIAGGHHEKMDGTGYPKQLHRDAMPLSARMMAIADIFEALTASDRPYKKAKTLSEAIRIMGFMKKDQHIDPQLFELFLESGVYLRYAHEFLDASQIDEVDVAAHTWLPEVP
jgi:HD-GYP domain-containing protein (c-di-GMP phosphodiesterase class II)